MKRYSFVRSFHRNDATQVASSPMFDLLYGGTLQLLYLNTSPSDEVGVSLASLASHLKHMLGTSSELDPRVFHEAQSRLLEHGLAQHTYDDMHFTITPQGRLFF